MSRSTVDFIEQLVARVPGLRQVFDEHITDNFGEVLPHLFFGDLTRYIVTTSLVGDDDAHAGSPTARAELQLLLRELEDAYAEGDDEIRELISVSFLENLPRRGEQGSAVRTHLGPELSRQLGVIG